MIEKIRAFKEYLYALGVILGFAGWLWTIDATASDAKKQADINAQTTLELAKIANKAASDLELMFKLGHITQQTFEDLRVLPTEPHDENGNRNPEWYLIIDTDIYVIKALDSCCQIMKIATE